MLMSELKNDHEATMAWGVEIDEDIFDPPANVRFVGLLWQGDGPEEISDTLIDTVIAFSLSGAEVVVEVRPTDEVDPEYLLKLAGNAKFSVSLLPPDREEDLATWIEQCRRFAQALLVVPNFSKTLFPVTGYQTYLILEMFAGTDALKPSDPYTLQRFVDVTPDAWSDAAKAAMRSAMAETLGGEDQLRDFLGAILRELGRETRRHLFQTYRDRKAG